MFNHNIASAGQPQRSALHEILERHFNELAARRDVLARRQQEFDRDGYTKYRIGELIPEELFSVLTGEAERLLESYAVRRDLDIATTGNSPRMMSNVPQRFIERHGGLIPALYNSPAVRRYVGEIVGDELASCWKDEEYVVNRLEKSGDTHGWHWGDYPYTIIWILRAPPLDQGGILQCVPHTRWNKEDPQIHRYLIDNPIRSYYHATGEAYLLRSDRTLHRVTPVSGGDCTRIVLNTCWASASVDQNQIAHETVDQAFI